MSRKQKSLVFSEWMPRHKTEDQQKIEKILREEQDAERQKYASYDEVISRQSREEQNRNALKSQKE